MKKVKLNRDEEVSVLHQKKYSFVQILREIYASTDLYNRFFCANVMYKKFVALTKESESVIKMQRPPIRYDKQYEDHLSIFKEALECSEEVHRILCSHYDGVAASRSPVTLRSVIEKWALIHHRMWSLARDKGLI